ncbi:MAG: dUTP diphosphatase [Bdellovibrionales bacterium]|nr:dUTP diphosphatase [Bdellovibrionales bacterium]
MKSSADQIFVKKMTPEAILPTRAHPDDAGLDLYAFENGSIAPGGGLVARTGIALALPAGTVGLVADRSSMAKRGVKTSGGVIDAGYRGEIHIVFRNITTEEVRFERGERIAQLLILPCLTPAVVESAELDETRRGTKGFGSSGR